MGILWAFIGIGRHLWAFNRHLYGVMFLKKPFYM